MSAGTTFLSLRWFGPVGTGSCRAPLGRIWFALICPVMLAVRRASRCVFVVALLWLCGAFLLMRVAFSASVHRAVVYGLYTSFAVLVVGSRLASVSPAVFGRRWVQGRDVAGSLPARF